MSRNRIFGSEGHPDPSDDERILAKRAAVEQLMSDGEWHTAVEIRRIGGSEGLKRFRDIRTGKTWGKRHLGHGLWEYRIVKELE